jgi:ATP-dependent RNA helicase DDX10/DBP4
VQPSDGESDEEDASGPDEDEKTAKKTPAVRTRYDRMFERKNQDILGDHRSKLLADEDLEANSASDEDAFNGAPTATDDFLTVKQRIPVDDNFDSASDSDARPFNTSNKLVKVHGISEPILVDSKRAEKRLQSKKKMLKYRDRGERLVFDEDGNARAVYELEDEEKFRQQGEGEEQRRKFVDEEREKVAEHDVEDKQRVKDRRMEKKIKRKQREKDEKVAAKSGAAADDDQDEVGAAPDLLQQFLEDTKDIDSSDSEGDERPAKKGKKEKKWFEKKGKVALAREDDEDDGDMDFEDLENMAAGLIEI